jgi:multidrug efflux system membrane fusion protein
MTKKRTSLLIILVLAGLLAGLGWLALRPPTQAPLRGGRGEEGPVPVLVAKAGRRDMPIEIETIGTVQALNTVTVRSQVEGRLIEIAFRDGQDVRAGDVLAKIDPTIYQAQYDQALAKKAQDEANLANARRDLERYLDLSKTEYAPKQQADTQRAVVDQIVAQIAADQALIDNAKAYLDYTVIRAPIDGRTGIRLIDQGNLIRGTDQTGIVTIAAIKPIAVILTLPQHHLASLTRALGRGDVPVLIHDGETGTEIDRGRVDVIDNSVDSSTGTIRLKASFPNADLQLWPGQFVTATITVGRLSNAITIPTSALQRGPSGPFVYVVNDETKAVMRSVVIARQTPETTAIKDDVGEGDTVVTNGFNRLTDGSAVRIDAMPAADAPSPGASQRGKGKPGNAKPTSQPTP